MCKRWDRDVPTALSLMMPSALVFAADMAAGLMLEPKNRLRKEMVGKWYVLLVYEGSMSNGSRAWWGMKMLYGCEVGLIAEEAAPLYLESWLGVLIPERQSYSEDCFRLLPGRAGVGGLS